jgi:putative Ca2+/H+ antiporter (TMEM165/GDT1 family)
LLAVFLATYGAVFIAEIVGDKLLYTTGVLATRYRPAAIVSGMGAAFMVKMAVAVLVGEAIAHLPRALVAAVTAASFAGVIVAVWRKPDVRKPKEKDTRIMQGAAVAFATIFFSEWGDVGMVMAGTMAAKYVWTARAGSGPGIVEMGLIVWLGAVCAMVTKGGLARRERPPLDCRARQSASRSLCRRRRAHRTRHALRPGDAGRSGRLTL